jgi:hypothetical protein
LTDQRSGTGIWISRWSEMQRSSIFFSPVSCSNGSFMVSACAPIATAAAASATAPLRARLHPCPA